MAHGQAASGARSVKRWCFGWGVTLRAAPLWLAGLLVATLGTAAQADKTEDIDTLMQAIQIEALVDVMLDEGLIYAGDIAQQMLAGGNDQWDAQVGRIYNPDRMLATVRDGLDQGLSETDLPPLLTFFASDLGREIVALETSARQAMLDATVEEDARLMYLDLVGTDDVRLALIDQFVTTNDLVETKSTNCFTSNKLSAEVIRSQMQTEGGNEQCKIVDSRQDGNQLILDLACQYDATEKGTGTMEISASDDTVTVKSVFRLMVEGQERSMEMTSVGKRVGGC